MSNYLALLNYNLTRVNASTINYSTLVGSTIIASSVVSNSSINVSNIIVQIVNYSTLTGSTLTTQAINYSTLTGSSMATNAMTTNALIVNSTLTGSTLTVQTINYSTLSGSTLTAQAINYSTLRGSTMTINTLVIASTLTVSTLIATNNPAGVITSSMISLGASTNQSYTALAQGNYSTSTNWLSTLNNLSSTKFVAMSGNAQTQLAVTQMNTVSSVYYTSTLGTSWSTISNVTGLPTATQTNYTCGAVSGNGKYGLLGTSNGNLYVTSTLTSATGPSFTRVNPPPASFIYLPFENSVADVQGNSIVTATGSPAYVTGIVGSTAINLANTANATATQYIRGTWSGLPSNVSLSGWFRATVVGSGWSVMFSSHSTKLSLYIEGVTGYFVFLFPSGSGSTFTLIKTSYAIVASTWYSFFATFQTNGVCSLYVNNILIGTSTNTGGYGSIVSTGYFSLGTYDNDTTLAFNGYIDDFRIYTNATTYNNVAISNSGQYMLATVANGGLVMSSNFGSTWSQVSAALLQAAWSLLKISSTGQYMSVYAPPVTVTPQLAGLTTSTWTVNGVTWTASASGIGSAGGANPYALFDTSTGGYWTSVTGTYNGSGVYVGGKFTYVNGQGSVYGEYVRLQSSTPLQLLSYTFATGSYAEYPNGLTIAGSNDGINWYLLQSVTMSGNPVGSGSTSTSSTYINVNQSGAQTMITSGGSATFNCTISPYSANAYTYFTFIFPAVFGGSQFVTLTEIYLRFTAGGQLYSTNYGSSWGNSYPTSTSTLALSGSGQYALENINTTTVTTTPQLAGLPNAIVGTWNVSGVVWTASTSSYAAAAQYYPTNAFSTNIDDSWSSGGGPYTPIYPNSGTNTVTIGVGTIYGEYLQLQNSVPLVMNSYTFMSGTAAISQMPRDYYMVGSNDGTNWYPIQYVVGIANPTTALKQAFTTYFNISYTGTQIITAGQVGSYYTTAYPTSGNAYTYFRMITTRVWHTTTSNVEIGKWYINFNNVFTQPQLTGLTGATTGNAVTSWTSNNVTWTSSASSTYSSENGYQPWRAFDNAISGSWASALTNSYNPVYQGTTYGTIILGGIGTIYGEWLQLQSSVPLVMNSYTFIASSNVQIPKNFYIVGSNDGTNWYPIQYVVGVTNAVNASGDGKPFTTYFNASYTGTQTIIGNQTGSYTTTAYSTSTNSYTYFRIIVTSIWTTGSVAEIGEWFINFSNTLTSPQLTGLSTASWTLNNIAWNASSSTNFNGSYSAYGAFDNATPGTTWVSATNYTNATPGVATGVTSTTVITSSPTTVNGEWLQLQSSTPLQMYSYTFVSTDPGQFPNTYTIAGSNDGTTWYLIQSVTMNQNPNTVNFQLGTYIIANQSGAQTYTTSTRSATFTCTTSAYSSNAYTYFRIIAPTIWVASISFGVGEWFINFTTTTVSPQLSGLTGNTSSSTPVATTWAANNITWTSNASSVYNANFQSWLAFNNVVPASASGNYSWASANNKYTVTTGVYIGSVTTTISAPYSAAYAGEWLQVQSSVPVVLYNYTFACGGISSIPKTYLITGSNDGTAWFPIQLASMASNPFGSTSYRPATSYLLANYTGTQILRSVTVPAGVTVTTTAYSTSSNAYTYFRIIANTNFGDPYFELEEWFLNFTPTQYVTSNYLSPTSSTPYTAPVFSPALTSTNVPITSAASQTGQYMVLITNNTSGANVYYSTNYGANFTGLTIGTSAMVSCAMSLDGSCITVMNATTVYQLNNNSIGYSVSVGNQAGQQNQYQNAIAIGNYAGQQNQTANSIVLNATGTALNSYVPGFYVSPVQQYGASTSSSFSLLGYGSDNQIVQTSPIISLSSGNVGIGTTNPVATLQIYGDATSSILQQLNEIKITGNGFAHWSIIGSRSGHNYFSISNTGNGPITGIVGTDVICITPSNNYVGIGTTNPINLLHVNGAMSVSWIQFNNSVVGGWHIYDNGTTNTLYILQGVANNGVYLANGGGSWTSWSDIRIKNTINPISGALNIINQLNPVTFYYKSDIKYEFLKSGFIAQEVQTILPGLVSDSSYSNEYGSNLLGVETTGFIPFIIKAIQEQNVIIQQQANKLQQQATEITALQSTVTAQSTQVLQTQVNSQQIQIAQLMSQINQLTQRLAAANIP